MLEFACLFVCVSAIRRIFTEWYLHRPDTQNSTAFLKEGPKTGPLFRAISQLVNHFEGPDFFVTFSQNVQKKNARYEALASIQSVLA